MRKRERTISKQFNRTLVLCVLVPFILSFVISLSIDAYSNWMVRISGLRLLCGEISMSNAQLLQPMDQMLCSYFANDEVMQTLQEDTLQTAEDGTDNITEFLHTLCLTNESILNIEWFMDDGRSYRGFRALRSERDGWDSMVQRLHEPQNLYSRQILIPTYTFTRNSKPEVAIAIARPIFNKRYEPVGYGVVSVKQSIFSKQIANLIHNPELNELGAQVLLLSEDDVFFASVDVGEESVEELLRITQMKQEGYRSLNEQSCYYIAQRDEFTELLTVVYLPLRTFWMSILDSFVMLLFIAVLVALMFFWITRGYIRNLTLPIVHLADALKNTSVLTVLHQPEERYVFNEIREVYAAYNQMLEANHRLVLRQLQDKDNISHLEQLILSTQINPHYFNNVLNVICSKAYVDGHLDIVRICENLAANFRYTLKKSAIVTLEDEREMIEHYHIILNHLYEREFRIIWSIEPGCEGLRIPKVTLQPLIENAVMHSLLQKENACTIWVSAHCRSYSAQLVIEDDGAGLSSTMAEQINASLTESLDSYLGNEQRHIGLRSVHYRLKAHFGDDYGIFITSGEHGGGKVVLEIP